MNIDAIGTRQGSGTLRNRMSLWLVLLVVLAALAVRASAAPTVITVPYRPQEPSIPHPAYNGKITIFKAICRDNVGSLEVSWDFDGNGVYDQTFTTTNPYDLSQAAYLPTVGQDTQFQAVIRVKDLSTGEYGYATYPVLVDASAPPTNSAAGASPQDLYVMKEVALDDALWALHQRLSRRINTGARIDGYLPTSYSSAHPSAGSTYLMALVQSGHLPAYPPGTYSGYAPPDFLDANDQRWDIDPYAEDAMRMVNWLLYYLSSTGIPTLDEGDDGTTPIPGTNDGTGFSYTQTTSDQLEYHNQSLPLAALANSGLAGTVSQQGNFTAGWTIEGIVQQMVDYAVAAQIDENSEEPARGGWYYSACYNSGWNRTYARGYQSGGWYYALITAEAEMGEAGVYVNERLRSRLPNMLKYNQSPLGGAWHNNGDSPSVAVFEITGLSLLACRWLGWDEWSSADPTPCGYPYVSMTRGQARTIHDTYYNYLTARWSSSGTNGSLPGYGSYLWTDGNFNSTDTRNTYIYAMLNTTLAAEDGITAFGSHDWAREFAVDLIQAPNLSTGLYSTVSVSYWLSNYLGDVGWTAYAAMILGKLGDAPPVVGDLQIKNLTLADTDAFVKNGDEIEVTATVTGVEASDAIRANLTALGGGPATVPDSFVGDVATWQVLHATCNPANGAVNVTITAYNSAGISSGASAGITADNIRPTALTGLTAAPGHREVALAWDDPSTHDANYDGLVIRYAKWDDYPLFSGSPLLYPTHAQDGDGEVFAGDAQEATHAFTADERAVYYYAAFISDKAGNFSTPSAGGGDRARSPNYLLGDVGSGGGGPYDGAVDVSDFTGLASTYGLLDTAPLFKPECDVGPTEDFSPGGVPQPDGEIEFEDLVIFAMNGAAHAIKQTPMGTDTPAFVWALVDETTWSLQLAAPCSRLKAVRLAADLPSGAVALVEPGDLVAAQLEPVFLQNIDRLGLDAGLAILGRGVGFAGQGELVRVTLPASAEIGEVRILARGLQNEPLDVEAETTSVAAPPDAFRLLQNHPNPFNPSTRIAFHLPAAADVKLAVYGLDGREVAVLLDEARPAGVHHVVWDGCDDQGRRLASGIYAYRLVAGAFCETRKMVVMK